MDSEEFAKALGWYTKFFDTFREYYSALGEESKGTPQHKVILFVSLQQRRNTLSNTPETGNVLL